MPDLSVADQHRIRTALERAGGLMDQGAGRRHCDSEVQDDYTILSLAGCRGARVWRIGSAAADRSKAGHLFWVPDPRMVIGMGRPSDELAAWVLVPEGDRPVVTSPSSRSEIGFAVWHGHALEVTERPGPWWQQIGAAAPALEAGLDLLASEIRHREERTTRQRRAVAEAEAAQLEARLAQARALFR